MLPPEIRNLTDSEKFRTDISKNLPTPNVLYWYGARQSNVTHARMQMGCSELNTHLVRKHVIDSPACVCGNIYEDAYHYLFVCPRYLVQRDKLITAVCQITSCTIGCLLYGSNNVDIKTNIEIFEHVHRYILNQTFPNQIANIRSHFGMGLALFLLRRRLGANQIELKMFNQRYQERVPPQKKKKKIVKRPA